MLSPARVTDIKATVEALEVSLAAWAELAVYKGVYLVFEHAWAGVPFRRFLIPFQLSYLMILV